MTPRPLTEDEARKVGQLIQDDGGRGGLDQYADLLERAGHHDEAELARVAALQQAYHQSLPPGHRPR